VGAGEGSQAQRNPLRVSHAHRDGGPPIQQERRSRHREELLHHYVSPALSERKQQQITEKLSQPVQPVVFKIERDSECSECGAELAQGCFLFMEAEQPLCPPCARLDDLEYLPACDGAANNPILYCRVSYPIFSKKCAIFLLVAAVRRVPLRRWDNDCLILARALDSWAFTVPHATPRISAVSRIDRPSTSRS
jgi:hypothetical protein